MEADAAQKAEMMFINYNICFPDRRTCPCDGCVRMMGGGAPPRSLIDVYTVASSPTGVGVIILEQGRVVLER